MYEFALNSPFENPRLGEVGSQDSPSLEIERNHFLKMLHKHWSMTLHYCRWEVWHFLFVPSSGHVGMWYTLMLSRWGKHQNLVSSRKVKPAVWVLDHACLLFFCGWIGKSCMNSDSLDSNTSLYFFKKLTYIPFCNSGWLN